MYLFQLYNNMNANVFGYIEQATKSWTACFHLYCMFVCTSLLIHNLMHQTSFNKTFLKHLQNDGLSIKNEY